MAAEFNIAASDNWFIGEDKTINVDVDQSDGSTPQTMTGWALTWELKDSATGVVRVTKTTSGGGVTISNGGGTDDRASVAVLDTDTEALAPGTFFHQLRRTDAGNEVVLAFGNAVLKDSGVR